MSSKLLTECDVFVFEGSYKHIDIYKRWYRIPNRLYVQRPRMACQGEVFCRGHIGEHMLEAQMIPHISRSKTLVSHGMDIIEISKSVLVQESKHRETRAHIQGNLAIHDGVMPATCLRV